MADCSMCDQANPASNKFCQFCGSQLPSVQQELADHVNAGFEADKFGSDKPQEVRYYGWPDLPGGS